MEELDVPLGRRLEKNSSQGIDEIPIALPGLAHASDSILAEVPFIGSTRIPSERSQDAPPRSIDEIVLSNAVRISDCCQTAGKRARVFELRFDNDLAADIDKSFCLVMFKRRKLN